MGGSSERTVSSLGWSLFLCKLAPGSAESARELLAPYMAGKRAALHVEQILRQNDTTRTAVDAVGLSWVHRLLSVAAAIFVFHCAVSLLGYLDLEVWVGASSLTIPAVYVAVVMQLQKLVVCCLEISRLETEQMHYVRSVGKEDWKKAGMSFRIQESGPWPVVTHRKKGKKRKKVLVGKYRLSLVVDGPASVKGRTKRDNEGRLFYELPTYDYLAAHVSGARLLQELMPTAVAHAMTEEEYLAEVALINGELRRNSIPWQFAAWSEGLSLQDFLPLILFSPLHFVALLMGYGYWATATYAAFVSICSFEAFLHAWSCLREMFGENRMEAVLSEISARWESRGLCWVQVSRTIVLKKDGLEAAVKKTEAQFRIRTIRSQNEN